MSEDFREGEEGELIVTPRNPLFYPSPTEKLGIFYLKRKSGKKKDWRIERLCYSLISSEKLCLADDGDI